MMNNNYLYMYLASGGSKFMILHKARFSLQQKNKFYLTTPKLPNIWEGNPNSNPN